MSERAVSGTRASTSSAPARPHNAIDHSVARQPRVWASSAPVTGISIVRQASTDIATVITCVPCCCSNRSRTIARPQTMQAAMPRPCAARAAISTSMFGAIAPTAAPAAYSRKPATSTGRRPKRSEAGPHSSWLNPKLNTSTASVSCTTPTRAAYSLRIAGSAAR